MVPAQYTIVLQKLAGKDDFPKDVNSKKKIDEDISENKRDNKKYLTGLLSNAKEQSVEKLFPGKVKKETNNPLLKVAFMHCMTRATIEKNAGQLGVMFIGFKDELDKIANVPAIPTPVGQVNKELGGFKSLVGHTGASAAGPGLGKMFGGSMHTIGKTIGAVR